MPELESIQNELNKKFGMPLDEFYERRIIFWNDEDGSFKDSIDELILDNAKVVKLTGSNNFEIKKLLSEDDIYSNYLIYNPLVVDAEDDWFLDLKLFSEDFRADQYSMWMQEVNITNTPQLRNIVKDYSEYFKNATRRNSLNKDNRFIDNPSELKLSLLSSICNIASRKPTDIIRKVLSGGDDSTNSVKANLLKYSASSDFWLLVANQTGYNGTSINDLAIYVILSAISNYTSTDVLVGLDSKYSKAHSMHCYNLVDEWIHNDLDSLKIVSSYVEKELQLRNRFEQFDVKKLVNIECLPSINDILIKKILEQIINRTFNCSDVLSIIDKRKVMPWFDSYKPYYDLIFYAIKMYEFNGDNLAGFHLTDAKQIWNEYTNSYYQMDTNYRKFHISFNRVLNMDVLNYDDHFKKVADDIENLYKNWFLGNLSNNWTTISEKELCNNGHIAGVKQQTDFYKDEVTKDGNKRFVIISDALRYEVAKELYEKLKIDTQSKIEIVSQEAIFPTITKYGMAALLPNSKITIEEKNENLKVLVNDMPTEAGEREKVLKKANANSVVLKYSDFFNMKKDEKREAVKGAEIVYIYHDTIDAEGHNESNIFDACETAIDELDSLVKRIVNDCNCYYITITSDHGFLYTYKPLEEEDKVDKSSFKENVKELGRRYVITDSNANPDFLMSIKGFYNDNNLLAFAPRENIRIKGSGSLNFVHGGTSLQEMIVPIIRYQHLRNSNQFYVRNKGSIDSKPVNIALLSSNRKICNMIFSLSFYQKEAVEKNLVACNYDVFITDEQGRAVSDKQKIVADKTSLDVKDREFRCTFNLKSQKFNSADTYYLVIQDEAGLQIPIKTEFQIDISMAFSDVLF